MGDSQPPRSAPVNLFDSYARRRGDRAEVVLAGPNPPLDGGGVVMVLRREGERLRSPARLVDDERGRRLVSSFPADGLTDGQWRVFLRVAGERIAPPVRLLVQGRRPMVLLWGARPAEPQIEV